MGRGGLSGGEGSEWGWGLSGGLRVNDHVVSYINVFRS